MVTIHNGSHAAANLSVEELTLYLIGEDLKCRSFFDGLHALGLNDDFYQPDLGSIILRLVGLDPCRDEYLDFYYHLALEHSSRISHDPNMVKAQALMLYEEIKEMGNNSKG